jgi:hypothetical protein
LLCLQGCGTASPWQGAGALYIAEKGKIVCKDVDSVTFVHSRSTEYKINGQLFETDAALDYHQGKKCEQ